MSIIKLTENLENFKWTDYSKAGTGKSPQQDGTDYFERPNPKSLDQMESKFGTLNTQPLDRGPYGVADYMDGTKQGRGFTPPGEHPEGFTVDMGESKYVIGTTGYTLTPLSHTIAGITSNGPHGSVPEHTIDIQFGSSWLNPVAPNAWAEDFMTLPLAEYVSQHSIEQNDSPVTRTFDVPDAYPNNSAAYSVNSQFGWAWPEGSEYLGIHGMPWRGFKLTTTVGDQMDTAGLENVIPVWYPSPPSQQVSHPTPPIYLNSEPSPAPSWLAIQFLLNHGVTDGIWPYKVLDYEGTHPLIRKEIGQRYQIGGVDTWMAVQVMRTGDDISRIEKWMETPQGNQWIINQHMLQELNPRSETRDWSKSNLILSIPPLFHATRHFGGDTYMDEADFGDLIGPEPPFSDALLGAGFTNAAKVAKFFENVSGTVDKIDAALGGLDFSGKGGRLAVFANKFLVQSPDGTSMLGLLGAGDFMGAASKFLTDARGGAAPLGRTPKIPTRYVNSQAGPFGEGQTFTGGGASELGGDETGTMMTSPFSLARMYATGDWTSPVWYSLSGFPPTRNIHLSTPYGELGRQNAYFAGGSFGSDSPIIKYSWRFFDLGNEKAKAEYWEGLKNPSIPAHKGIQDKVFTLNKDSNKNSGDDDLIKRYTTLSYGDLGRVPYQSVMMSPSQIKEAGDAPSSDDPKWSEIKSMLDGSMAEHDKNKIIAGEYNQALDRTELYKKWEAANSDWEKANTLEIASRIYINDKNAVELAKGGGTGNQGALGVKPVVDLDLGIIKRGSQDKYNNELVDKVNMIPYGEDYTAEDTAAENKTSDFIKFKFYDIHNDKFIIFRAILSGISDAITPEWSGTRYLGRPDQVYVYTGTERKVSFNFEIYPKTKQEFPVLLEKMNYLVGLCYPSFTSTNRMVAPFINLTIGDMFNKTPGFLDSLSVDVDDTSTWELENGLQFPKHITCQCSFTYVGKYLPSTLGKHYGLGWLEDKGWSSKGSEMVTKGTFELDNEHPSRTKYTGLFSDLGAENAQ